MRPRRVAIYRCSFCQKEQWQVKRLIGGPGNIYICNECVYLCGEIIAEELAAPTAEPPMASLLGFSPHARRPARLTVARLVES